MGADVLLRFSAVQVGQNAIEINALPDGVIALVAQLSVPQLRLPHQNQRHGALGIEAAIQEEAEFLLKRIRDYDITLPVVYDWEQVEAEDARTNNMDARTLTDCTLAFCRVIEEAGYDAMIYFNRNQGANLMYLEELTEYPFWLAAYTDRMPYPYLVEMWQYTDRGRVPGIEGNVDINVMFFYE